jgi:hypothetical protein
LVGGESGKAKGCAEATANFPNRSLRNRATGKQRAKTEERSRDFAEMDPAMKAPTKQQVLDLLGILAVTTGTAAGFAIGGLFGSEVMAALGIELGGKIIGRRSLKLRERWLSSDDGVLNHDIQKALARAFVKALEHIEERYFKLPQADELSKEEKKYVKGLFRRLKEQAPKEFSACLKEDTQKQATQKEDAQKQALDEYLYAADEAAAVEKLWQRIDGTTLLSTENEDFEKFLRESLFVELQFWFGEELKTDNRESNRAWNKVRRHRGSGIRKGCAVFDS